jgi:enoyl-CoA hydratase/carnithine racemase
LVGHGRALEIILGANDFDGHTAERHGYVNQALPDVPGRSSSAVAAH